MRKNNLIEKKKVILFVSLLLIFGLFLTGCNWFGEGILNVFDPKAQVRVNCTDLSLTGGSASVDLEVYTINQVEFFVEEFNYKYYDNGILIPQLTKSVGTSFYVAPSLTAGSAGPKTTIEDLPLYYQDVKAYMASSPTISKMTCTLTLIGTDGTGKNISQSVTVDIPIDYFPEISIILTATPASFESEGGNALITAYVVTDPYGQPVKGLNVIFTTNGGVLSTDVDITDSFGRATTNLELPENNSDEDKNYTISAYVGDEQGSVTITVFKSSEELVNNIEISSCN